MKKILTHTLITLCISTFWSIHVFAAECSNSCKISDAPAPALTEYLTNIERISQNILSSLSGAEQADDQSQKWEKMRVLGSLNDILSFGKHFWSFDFEISLPITNEVPPQVKRDYNILKQKTEKLTKILETTERRGTAGVLVEDACNWVSNCEIENKSARFLLVQLIKNNEEIIELYRSSLLDKAYISENPWFIIVSDDFRSQIEEYYSKDTLTSCSACEGGFMDRVSEKITTISNFTSWAQEGVKEWQDAWKLARWWSTSPMYAEQEAVLLAGYLETEWISTEQSGIVMDNLEKYGSGGLSSSNALFNSKNYAQSQVKNSRDTFWESVLEVFQEQEKTPFLEVTRVDSQLQDTESLSQSIASIYEEQLPFSLTQDTAAQQLQARLIRMHFSLVNSINILSKQVPQTEKLCDKQGTWLWKCTFQ